MKKAVKRTGACLLAASLAMTMSGCQNNQSENAVESTETQESSYDAADISANI